MEFNLRAVLIVLKKIVLKFIVELYINRHFDPPSLARLDGRWIRPWYLMTEGALRSTDFVS